MNVTFAVVDVYAHHLYFLLPADTLAAAMEAREKKVKDGAIPQHMRIVLIDENGDVQHLRIADARRMVKAGIEPSIGTCRTCGAGPMVWTTVDPYCAWCARKAAAAAAREAASA